MSNIKIISSGKYIPKIQITNKELEEKYSVEENYIFKMTGIKQRFYAEEKIEELAINAAEKALDNIKENIDLIIVASVSETNQMPSISYKIQKYFNIKNCMCIDILAGCAGFINAFDIAKMYIDTDKINTALVVGVEKLSNFIDKTDINTEILLSDGAGAIVVKKSQEPKLYYSYIESKGQKGDILTYTDNNKIYMNGKEIYKYAVTDTVKNINKLLDISNLDINELSYIIPHQSNKRILESIAKKINIKKEKMYFNVDKYGNTFCASIPIAIDDMIKLNKLKEKDKVILIGYGGGLNTGSILLEF
ncbi:MAG: 3-oxoacyl-ACP synthase III family protein [Clostridia bacterium]|jgi:3-oxoacyl-[acyl-carrier-protein] synthase 3